MHRDGYSHTKSMTRTSRGGSRYDRAGYESVVARDPQIERIDDDLGMAHRAEANRAITAGAAFAVILCVAALVAVVAGAYWLLA